MNLKEVALMVSLINANYHRRMAYFWVNVLITVISVAVIYYNCVIDHNDHSSAYSSFILIVLSCIGLFFSLFRAFIVYGLKPGKFDDDPSFPWSIRKFQMNTLRQCVDGKVDFEDLRTYVPLQEYFEMN